MLRLINGEEKPPIKLKELIERLQELEKKGFGQFSVRMCMEFPNKGQMDDLFGDIAVSAGQQQVILLNREFK